MATERQRLAIRGAGASFATNLVAAVSHTLGGEQAPAPLIVLGMMALLWGPAMLLMGRRPRAVRIAATVAVAQAAFHTAYAALGAPSGVAVAGDPHAAHAGHAHHALAVGAPLEVGPLMIAAHVGAAIVTFLILFFGERAIAAIRAWTIASLRARTDAPPARPAVRLPRAAAARYGEPLWRAVALVGPRGPPLPSV